MTGRESLCFLLGKSLNWDTRCNFRDGRFLWGGALKESSPPYPNSAKHTCFTSITFPTTYHLVNPGGWPGHIPVPWSRGFLSWGQPDGVAWAWASQGAAKRLRNKPHCTCLEEGYVSWRSIQSLMPKTGEQGLFQAHTRNKHGCDGKLCSRGYRLDLQQVLHLTLPLSQVFCICLDDVFHLFKSLLFHQ